MRMNANTILARPLTLDQLNEENRLIAPSVDLLFVSEKCMRFFRPKLSTGQLKSCRNKNTK